MADVGAAVSAAAPSASPTTAATTTLKRDLFPFFAFAPMAIATTTKKKAKTSPFTTIAQSYLAKKK